MFVERRVGGGEELAMGEAGCWVRRSYEGVVQGLQVVEAYSFILPTRRRAQRASYCAHKHTQRERE